MAKAPNYNNVKVKKTLGNLVVALQKATPKLQDALTGNLFRKAEMKEVVALSKKLGDAVAIFNAEIEKQEA